MSGTNSHVSSVTNVYIGGKFLKLIVLRLKSPLFLWPCCCYCRKNKALSTRWAPLNRDIKLFLWAMNRVWRYAARYGPHTNLLIAHTIPCLNRRSSRIVTSFTNFVRHLVFRKRAVPLTILRWETWRYLTLRLLISYIYMELLVKPEMLTSYVYGPTFGNAETVSFYLLHNVSTLNQCREVSCVTFVCKHFAS